MSARPHSPVGIATFVVVANRLPVDRVENSDGSADWRPSPGGLVTAFEPVMRSRDGAWVGWHGAPDEELAPFTNDGIKLVPVTLSSRRGGGLLRGILQRAPSGRCITT